MLKAMKQTGMVLLILASIGVIGGAIWISMGERAPDPAAFSFGEKSERMPVKVFFSNAALGSNEDCTKVFPATRMVEKTQAVARAALSELLKGPTFDETRQGYVTNINPGVVLQWLSVSENGIAEVDMSSDIERGLGGSCRVAALRAQINETMRQFPTVKDIIISVDGRIEDALQP